MYNPPTTIKPNKTSYQTTFFPNNKGSKIDVKKAPVDKQAKVTETLETFMALKKVNQCKAITNPANRNANTVFLGIFVFIFLNLIYIKIKTTAKDILHQTKGKASKEIKAPKIAVKPQIKTIR